MSAPGEYVRGNRQRSRPPVGNRYAGPARDGWASDFFVYALNFGTITPPQPIVQRLNVQQDSDFEWVSTVATAATAGTSPFPSLIANISVQIDDSRGRPLMSNPVPLVGLAGGLVTLQSLTAVSVTGSFLLPLPLTQTKILPRTTQWNFTLKNLSTVNYTNVWLALIGQKVWSMG